MKKQEAAAARFNMRLTPAQHEKLEKLAKKNNMSKSHYVKFMSGLIL
jgi:predicted DNA-binding protein